MKKLFTVLLLATALTSCSNDESLRLVFQDVKEGDSLFISSNFGFDVYKKVRKEYKYYGARDPKAPADTIDFEAVASVDSKYFYQNKTSFLGVSSGKDSTVSNPASVGNSQWIAIKPDQKLIDFYLQGHNSWNDGTKTPYGTESIGDHNLYIKASVVSLKKNDSTFK